MGVNTSRSYHNINSWCAYSISEGFMKDGQRCDGINERGSDWNHIQVIRECRLNWMQ
jgi:hypothetical protein